MDHATLRVTVRRAEGRISRAKDWVNATGLVRQIDGGGPGMVDARLAKCARCHRGCANAKSRFRSVGFCFVEESILFGAQPVRQTTGRKVDIVAANTRVLGDIPL